MLVASPEYRAADGTEDMRLSSSLLLCTLSIEEKKTESECVLKSFTPLCVCVCLPDFAAASPLLRAASPVFQEVDGTKIWTPASYCPFCIYSKRK